MTEYNKRLDEQITWYSKKATSFKRWWKLHKILTIALSGGIVYGGYFNNTPVWAFGAMGLDILASESLESAFKLHENWINYRTTSESLKHEKHLFHAHAGPYDGLDESKMRKLLAERCEQLISRENSEWVMTLKKR